MTDFKMVPIGDIRPDPNQPRKIYDETAMAELTASVKEKGVLQPILLRPNGKGMILVCGERRYRASKEAGLEEIPAVIRTLTDDEALELQIIENLQRKDVHPMEEAVAFKSLIENKSKPLTIEETAARVGKSVFYVRQRMKLNALSTDWQLVFLNRKIPVSTALSLSQLEANSQAELYKDNVTTRHLSDPAYSVSVSQWQIERAQCKLDGASFDKKDPNLNPEMGPCTSCSFNTAVASLFPEDAKSPRCNKPSCFETKSNASFTVALAKAQLDPAIVLVDNQWYRSKKDPIAAKLEKEGCTIYTYGNPEQFERVSTSSKDYKEGVKTGKVLKAFVVVGDDKGKFIYIKLLKKGASKAAAKNVAAGQASTDDIDEEIKRLKDREKRSKELDGEKVWAKVRELAYIEDNQKRIFVTNELQQFEREALAAAIEDKMSYGNQDWIEAQFPDGFAGITDLGLNILFRVFIIDVLATAVGSHLEENSDNYHAFRVIREYLPSEVASIELTHQEASIKRQDRVSKRIKDLQAQKKAQLQQVAETPKKSSKKAKA